MAAGPQELLNEAAAQANVTKVVRSRRLSALVRDPEPLFEECHQRMLDLKHEAATQRGKVNNRRRQDTDLLRQLQSEFASADFGQENVPGQGKEVHSARRSRQGGGNSRPLGEIMPQLQLGSLACDKSSVEKIDRRSPVIDRLIKQGSVSTSSTPRDASSHAPLRPRSQRSASGDRDSIWTDRSSIGSGRGSARSLGRNSSSGGSRRQKTPLRSRAEKEDQGGLLQKLTTSGFESSALTECITKGGTDLLFDALSEATSGSLVRAELVGLLLVLVAQGFPQSTGREAELLLELKGTLATLYDAAEWACVQDSEQFRELPTRLCEGLVCFTAHGDLKRNLCEAPETLQVVLDFLCNADLSQPSLAFAVASLLFNLCRGEGDLEMMGITVEMLNAGLRQDSLLGLLYSDVLAAASPGSAELASFFRDALCASFTAGAPPIGATLLVRCAESCPRAAWFAALTLRLLCLEPEHRTPLATADGVVSMLLALSESDSMEEAFCTGMRQALAQICITTDPALISPDDQLRGVDSFVQLMQHSDEQVQLDGAMGLTNLLTTGDEVRSAALQAGAWSLCQELLFSECQAVRRAATEAMCNFTAAPEVVEFCACGQCDLELQVFTSFCAAPDRGTQVAATGALAMLARHPEVALRIASGARLERLLEVLAATDDADIEHRVVSCLNGLYHTPDMPAELHQQIQQALVEKLEAGGFASSDAEALAASVLEEES